MLSVKQAAEKLQVTAERVRQLIYAGALPAVKFDRVWMVPEYAVEQRLSSQPKPGRPSATKRSYPQENEITTLCRNLYEESKQLIEGCGGLPSIMTISDDRTRQFMVLIWGFITQEKQQQLIDAGIF
ncbi:MAG: helix-turn-helix domain-containing protein [Coriobacteriia bacterium]|nr:helix-turn-helix domain-containing protein [Coriobacteriia bacterium]